MTTNPGSTVTAPASVAAGDRGVFADVVGQAAAVAACRAAVAAAAPGPGRAGPAMTHAWLFTGPPGSGRSVAARAFAAALQCDEGGCGRCAACHTVLAATHADVRTVAPEGLSIPVREMRAVVRRAASRPTTGRWQIVLIEDADRLTEGAANALLKSVEQPPDHTVFLLCAPSTHPDDVSVTIQSRCRLVRLVTPSADAIAEVLVGRDGIDEATARWAASVCGGHVGRARALAHHDDNRRSRAAALELATGTATIGDALANAKDVIQAAKSIAAAQAEAKDAAERDELKTALGAGGTGKGAAAAARGSAGAVKELEKRQLSRQKRTVRDVLDRALVDLSSLYRDVIAHDFKAAVASMNPDVARDIEALASRIGARGALQRLDAVLACREALTRNVKPEIAVEALMMSIRVD